MPISLLNKAENSCFIICWNEAHSRTIVTAIYAGVAEATGMYKSMHKSVQWGISLCPWECEQQSIYSYCHRITEALLLFTTTRKLGLLFSFDVYQCTNTTHNELDCHGEYLEHCCMHAGLSNAHEFLIALSRDLGENCSENLHYVWIYASCSSQFLAIAKDHLLHFLGNQCSFISFLLQDSYE